MKPGRSIIFFFLLFTTHVYALPDMVRHGYPSCTSCHFSPAGGGLLNPYGHVQASEILSTVSLFEAQELTAGPVSFGGQMRVLQTLRVRPKNFAIGYFLMQLEPMVGVQLSDFSAVANFEVQSRRPTGFVQYRHAFETFEIGARAGKFLPHFGVTLADHFLAVRGALQPGSEDLGVELSARTESISLSLQAGQTLCARAAVNLWNSEIGFSWSSRGKGPFAMLAWMHNLFSVLQWNIADSYLASLEWELYKGMRLYAMVDNNQPAAGARWYPLPNIELRVHGQLGPTEKSAFALLHLYL